MVVLKNFQEKDNLSLVIYGPGDLRLEQTLVKEKLEPNGKNFFS